MLGWILELRRRILKGEVPAETDEQISAKVDAFYEKLLDIFPGQGKCIGKVEFNIGYYSFSGGWLTDSFYFDVYDLRQEFKLEKEGRIYIGYEFRSDSVQWSAAKRGEKNKTLVGVTYVNTNGIIREDLVKAINFVVPNLIKE